LTDKLAAMRKEFDKQSREKEATAQKHVRVIAPCACSFIFNHNRPAQAINQLQLYFEDNKEADAYFGVLDVSGNAKVGFSVFCLREEDSIT
jgi:hypothetical protein